jgi:hypothetical protein
VNCPQLSRPLGALVLSLGLLGPAAKAQTVINYPSEFTGATGYLTLENPLVDGSIFLISGQGGWAF